MKRLTLKGYALAGALGLALGLSGCGATGTTPTASPSVQGAVRGEEAYLAAAEQRLDVAIDTDGSFEQYPEMRQAALDVSATTCDLLDSGATEADLFDLLAEQTDDETVLALLRYWITAATTYVC